MITVSAPGKIHLLGEHAVVYGKPALLSAVDRRIYVTLKAQKEIIINTKGKKDLVWEIIEMFQKSFSINQLPPLEINITSQIPEGCGLGSSAALSAALLGALTKFIKNIWNPHKINELAYGVEKKAHGNASGADNTAVVFGGLVWFRREFDFLKSIWSLPISTYKIPSFMIIDSGRPMESTKEMVTAVAKLYTRKKKVLDEIFADQEIQTKKLLLSLKNGNDKELIIAVKNGESNLEKIRVVGNFAKKIIRSIESIGGAAKICGAGGKKGGSGIILCYYHDLAKLKAISDRYKVNISPVKLGEEGIRLERLESVN